MAKILICDDATFIRLKLAQCIKGLGHSVVEAENGEVAIEKYKAEKPDMVFMDITMPVLDGLGALKEIMAFDKAAKVVMLTNIGEQTVIMEAITIGAKDYNLKPFTDDKIEKTIKNILR